MSESGAGYTWAENSRENQLTPWSNDPVSDPPSEALYVRDDDSGELWSPDRAADPMRADPPTSLATAPDTAASSTVHAGIQLDLVQFVLPDEPVKVSVLAVENRSGRPRRLSVTAYAEWVLGTSRGASAPWIVTECEPETGALLATNPWNTEFGGRVAFLDLGGRQTAWTADRTEFLGRNGGPERAGGTGPRARTAAGGRARAWIRARRCRRASSWPHGERTEIVVLLGQAEIARGCRRSDPARPRAADHRGHAARDRSGRGTTC